MNIIVLMKLCANPEKGVMKKDGTVDREKSEALPNPYDRNALEEALKIREKHGGKISIIFMGRVTDNAKEMLKDALARAAGKDKETIEAAKDDEAIILCDEILAASDTRATSYALAKAIKKIGRFDLIFCGMQAIDGDTAQVGPQVAEELGIPQITYVKEVVEVRKDSVAAKRLIEGGEETDKASLPVLLTVTNLANEPRLPSLKGMLAAKGKKIFVWKADDVGIDEKKVGLAGSPTRVKKIQWLTKEKSDCKLAQGENALEQVSDLLEKMKEDKVDLKGASNE